MKKIFACVLALCLLCGAAALAETKQTILTAEIDESYTIVIPATVEIGFEAERTELPVKVTALRTLSKGTAADTLRKLAVKMAADKKLTNENGDNLAYTVNADALYFTAVGSESFVIAIAQAAWDAAPAGAYTDTVTFDIAIGDYAE